MTLHIPHSSAKVGSNRQLLPVDAGHSLYLWKAPKQTEIKVYVIYGGKSFRNCLMWRQQIDIVNKKESG